MYSPWAQQEFHIHFTLKQYKIAGWHNGKRAKHRDNPLTYNTRSVDLTDESMLKTKFKKSKLCHQKGSESHAWKEYQM
jgi:hypothetical protein